jgi:hypothetical protein
VEKSKMTFPGCHILGGEFFLVARRMTPLRKRHIRVPFGGKRHIRVPVGGMDFGMIVFAAILVIPLRSAPRTNSGLADTIEDNHARESSLQDPAD